MRILALCGGSFPCCEPEVTDSTAFKVGLVAIGLLFAGSGLAIYLLQVNSIAAFTLMGASGSFFSAPFCPASRVDKACLFPALL